jgi:hypothetical protein
MPNREKPLAETFKAPPTAGRTAVKATISKQKKGSEARGTTANPRTLQSDLLVVEGGAGHKIIPSSKEPNPKETIQRPPSTPNSLAERCMIHSEQPFRAYLNLTVPNHQR